MESKEGFVALLQRDAISRFFSCSLTAGLQREEKKKKKKSLPVAGGSPKRIRGSPTPRYIKTMMPISTRCSSYSEGKGLLLSPSDFVVIAALCLCHELLGRDRLRRCRTVDLSVCIRKDSQSSGWREENDAHTRRLLFPSLPL